MEIGRVMKIDEWVQRMRIKKLGRSMKQKRWEPEMVKIKTVIVSDDEYSERLAVVGKCIYDHYCQRQKESQNLNLGMIQEVQEIELKRTGTDG